VALTKAEVNERFYNTVGGRIAFETEAQGYLHPYAVAKLAAGYARARGRRELKLLELGANNCAFALSLLKLLTSLTVHGEVELDRIDFFAVELARPSLESFLAEQEQAGEFQRVSPGAAGGPLVGSLVRLGVPQVSLHLVHAEAGAFVSGGSGGYDLVVLNELLDDLPCRVFYAGADGRTRELHADASEEDGRWHVTLRAAEAADAPELPPSTLTVTSPESLAVVRGAAALLAPGGLLLVHDYGIAERHAPLAQYEREPPPLPGFVTLELPPGAEEGGFPRAFYRLFASEEAGVVQITTDVNFAELAAELEPHGAVVTLPHGNALLKRRGGSGDDLRRGDGIFLSELGLLERGDDLDALLARLGAEQAELRRRFAAEHLDGRSSVYADLLFVKR